jgi:hypothetical protein
MSEKLWVEYKIEKRVIKSKVSIEGCGDVDDFIERIKSHTQFSSIKDFELILCTPSGETIDAGESPSSLLPGNTSKNPLHLRVSAPPLITSELVPDADSTSFWNSLRDIKNEKGFLRFPIRPRFFPKRMKLLLYIRKAYVDMFDIICKNLEIRDPEKRLAGMVITGTPGIGKSVFLFYIMWKLANMKVNGKVILHRQADKGRIYIFQNNECRMTHNPGNIEGFLDDPATWYLADALLPPPEEEKAVTILVSSPARKYYSKFLECSNATQLYYLPIWSLEELQLVAPFYSKTSRVIKERFAIIGGLPRYVIEKDVNLKRKVKGAFSRHSDGKFERIVVDGLVNENEISHLLVHFKVWSNYLDYTLNFASKYVAEIALKLFLLYQQEELRQLLRSGGSSPFLGSLLGYLFENYAHRILSAGGLFAGRSLDDGTLCGLVLPKMDLRRFYNLSECKNGNVYYMAAYKNQPCFESIVRGKGYFQMTMAKYHPISRVPMERIVERMKMNNFYFVVPDWLFDTFKKQAFKKQAIKKQAIKRQAIKRQAIRNQAIRKQAIKRQTIRKQAIRKQAIKKQVFKGKKIREGPTDEEQMTREQAFGGQAPMEGSSSSIGNSDRRNKKQKITHAKNENLTNDFLRQYVISIPIQQEWDSLCLVLKTGYGITAEDEERMRSDVKFGMHMIFDDGEEEKGGEEEEDEEEENEKTEEEEGGEERKRGRGGRGRGEEEGEEEEEKAYIRRNRVDKRK